MKHNIQLWISLVRFGKLVKCCQKPHSKSGFYIHAWMPYKTRVFIYCCLSHRRLYIYLSRCYFPKSVNIRCNWVDQTHLHSAARTLHPRAIFPLSSPKYIVCKFSSSVNWGKTYYKYFHLLWMEASSYSANFTPPSDFTSSSLKGDNSVYM